VFFNIKRRIQTKRLKYVEIGFCSFVDWNLHFNIKGIKYTKQLIPQLQENVPHSMFQQEPAPLHFHAEVGMIPLIFIWIWRGGSMN